MKIKNLKVNHKNLMGGGSLKRTTKGVVALGLIPVIGACMTACGSSNYDVWDTNKTFDFAIISAEDRESALITGIKQYATYEGEQEQIILDDGSVLLASSFNMKLIRNEGNLTPRDYAEAYITDEGEITEISEVKRNGSNRDWWDSVYTYHKAIVFEGNTAIIYNIDEWCTYAEDDTVQIRLDDGSYLLTGIHNAIMMQEGKTYTAEDIAYGVLGSDAVVKTFDTKEGYKTLTK